MTDEEAILQQNERLDAALIDADRDMLVQLLQPAFIATHITGQQQTPGEWIDQVAAGRMQYQRIRKEAAVAHVDGDTAVLMTRDRIDATMWGRRGTRPLESVGTYTRTGDGWRLQRSTASTYRNDHEGTP